MDSGEMRLGKAAPRYDPATLKLARYLDVATVLPQIPPATTRAKDLAITWPMFANDRMGDCTCAAMGHMSMFWSALANEPSLLLTDTEIVGAYSAITGYDPATGQNDQGAVELDVLRWWQQNGLSGHKISAFAAINLANHAMLKAAIYLFDGAYLGVALPASAKGASAWNFLPGTGSMANPGSWGGHAVNAVDYDDIGVYLISWGRVYLASWDFLDNYMDEAYAVLAPEAINVAAGKTAEGFDLTSLLADLPNLAG